MGMQRQPEYNFPQHMSKILKVSVRVIAAHTELPTVETDIQTDAGVFRSALPASAKRNE